MIPAVSVNNLFYFCVKTIKKNPLYILKITAHEVSSIARQCMSEKNSDKNQTRMRILIQNC